MQNSTGGLDGLGYGLVMSKGTGAGLAGWLEDAGLLLLGIFLIPLAILAVGTPIVLTVRLLVAIAHRL